MHYVDFRQPTLIVCPLGLVDHWANEFATKVWPSRRFRVAVVKSAERPVYPEDVRDAQIIIAAYGSVARGMVQAAVSEFGRVILDDSHIMAGPETACARACCALVAPIRWCVTATPIMASPEDLFTQLRFIGYKPTRALWQFKEMATPSAVAPDADEDAIEQAKSEAASRLFKTMEHVMLRRVKSLSPFHRSVVVLPQQVDHSRLLGGYHSPRQAAYYRALAADGERLIATALQQAREDVEMSSMAPVMALLVRLRRPSTRPHLWMHPCEATNTGMSDEEMLEQARQLPSDVVRRLLTHTGSLPAHLSQGSEKDDCSTSDDDEAIMDRGLAASDGYSGRAGSITVEPGFRCIIGHEDVVNPLLGALCGHAVCDECFNRRADIVRGITGCPMCRAPLHDDRMFSYLAFRDVHVPADDDYEHRRLAGFVSQPSTAAPTVDEEVRDLEIAWDRIPIDWCEPERPRQHGET